MKHTPKFLQRRKFFMVLPLLVLPFVTMIFWALGGGSGIELQAMPIKNTGLNAALPDAKFEDEQEDELWDKFKLYESAARDSAEYATARENDPYFDLIAFQSKQDKQKDDPSKLIGTFKHKDILTSDPNEDKVNNKLEQLYREINRASQPDEKPRTETEDIVDSQFADDVSRLEGMMESMHEDQADADPEMKQIETMMDKLLDIQHPERVRERMSQNQKQQKNSAFTVMPSSKKIISSFENRSEQTELASDSLQTSFPVSAVENSFYSLDEEVNQDKVVGNAIAAIIHETQQLVAGANVRMRVAADIIINGITIPKDHFIYGNCSISGERLLIQVTSIRYENTLLPVSLSVYDLDGLEGIYIPGAITRDAAKQASDDALQNVQLLSMDTSLGAQAASAGIEATKGLLSQKAKLVKVTVKAGYKIFLKDTQAKD